jgi:energy-coupling factor transporter ATP-binding protein EcfA2
LPAVLEKDTNEYINLPLGTGLTEATALDLAKSRPVQWIVLAGPIGCGKTTLLVSLYELFQWAKVEGCAFAGSETLPAFEERCFLSRKDSGNVVPDTPRTIFRWPDPVYLHLRIRLAERPNPFRDFLWTDVSGEVYEHARDSTSECKELTFLRRANHLVVLLDSAKGVQSDERWAMVEEARALLYSCVYSKMIGANCLVNLVWSRFDYFVNEQTDKQHEAFRADAEEELRATFHNLVPKLTFGQVAARPLKAPKLGIGHGVPALLKHWAAGVEGLKEHDLFPESYAGRRESELFATRHFSLVRGHEESGR